MINDDSDYRRISRIKRNVCEFCESEIFIASRIIGAVCVLMIILFFFIHCIHEPVESIAEGKQEFEYIRADDGMDDNWDNIKTYILKDHENDVEYIYIVYDDGSLYGSPETVIIPRLEENP